MLGLPSWSLAPLSAASCTQNEVQSISRPLLIPPAAEAHQEQLREWLTDSPELPETTRKWPAWRKRLVPKVLAALASEGSEGEVRAPNKRAQASRGAVAAAAVADGEKGGSPDRAAAAAGLRAAQAKENRHGNSRTVHQVVAVVNRGAAAAPVRTSMRQRKASSKYSEQFLVEVAE